MGFLEDMEREFAPKKGGSNVSSYNPNLNAIGFNPQQNGLSTMLNATHIIKTNQNVTNTFYPNLNTTDFYPQANHIVMPNNPPVKNGFNNSTNKLFGLFQIG